MHRPSGIVSLALAAALLSFHVSTSIAAADIKSRFDLPEEPLDRALRDFAVQANCNISYEPSIVAGLNAPAIKGEYTPANVLSILLAGTRLRAVNVNEDTIQVLEVTASSPREMTPSSKSDSPRHIGAVRVAYVGPDVPAAAGASSDPQATDRSGGDEGKHADKDLQEIVVTGTHIRGAKDSPSPVEVYTRADIDATGANTLQQFLQTLPQNFGGGASENTLGGITGGGQTNNAVNGSAPNLRGLGTDATLVLINGHRVAPGNYDGGFVDVSMIPLTAIDRVEIVTDGASAIYGSDAVGGVVNFILRSKFDGSKSPRIRVGQQRFCAQYSGRSTVGNEWAGGSAVLSYQYFDQTPLSAGSRDYLTGVQLPFMLLPQQVEHAVFGNIDQKITPDFALHGDLLYSHRSTNTVYTADDGTGINPTTSQPSGVDGYSASLGSTLKLAHESELGVLATYSESDTSRQSFQVPLASPLQFISKTKSTVISLDTNLDGILATIPAGSVHYAIGGQYRKESFGNTYLYPPTDSSFYSGRRVGAGYIELRVPLLGPSIPSRDEAALELTLADRGEHYSDFGSTNNPQVGAIWKPLQTVAVRSTFGTSFISPPAQSLNPVHPRWVIVPGTLFNPVPGGAPNTLEIYGGNPNLKPEKATVWTVGLDFKLPQAPNFTAKLTYYDIVFKDQIVAAGNSICDCNAFAEESILGPEIVQRNPSAALVQQLVSEPSYVNLFDVDPKTVGAIFDSRNLNLSTVRTRGLDFHFTYKTPLARRSV